MTPTTKNNKAFISGKITGDPNYREKFAKVEAELKAKGYHVMNPAILPDGFTWEEYMVVTKAMLSVCDTTYMMDGWEDSDGAKTERIWSKTQGNTILYQTSPK